MTKTIISGVGHYVPDRIVTNQELMKIMDTSHEWIVERTGIEERRFADRHTESTTSMATIAARRALESAGVEADQLDFIIFATLSPDYYFPGCGVLLQRALGITKTEIGALDVRNQCTGFVYALSIADQFVRSGMYNKILVVGSEMHSMGLDFTTRGRNVSVLFGDGAGAVVVQSSAQEGRGILSSHLHSDGTHAEQLAMINPGSHGGYHDDSKEKYGFSDNPWDSIFVTQKMIDDALLYPDMDGPLVFKTAVSKFPQVIMEALSEQDKSPADLKLLIPHQANLRISQFVQKKLHLSDDQVYNNIQRYGNTTAATIPIALSEAVAQGRIEKGDLVCFAAFGSGFTWGSVLLNW